MTPPSRRRRLPSPDHLVWVLPLLAGSAAWLHAHQAALARSGTSSAPGRERETVERPERYRGDPSGLFEATLRDHPRPPSAQAEPQPQAPPTGEARRARLLEIYRHAENYPMTSTGETREMDAMARDLGRDEGAAGLAWMDANLPAVRRFAMDGWAGSDPAAAFATLVRGDRVNAAFHSTVMKLLAGRAADGGPDALRAAVAQVPWHLFPRDDFSYPGQDEAGVFPLQGEAKVWIDSGVAQSLAGQGVQIGGLYREWAAYDPAAALQAWADWPVAPGSRDARHFQELAESARQTEQNNKALTQAIADASPGVRERLAALKLRLQQSESTAASEEITALLPADPP